MTESDKTSIAFVLNQAETDDGNAPVTTPPHPPNAPRVSFAALPFRPLLPHEVKQEEPETPKVLHAVPSGVVKNKAHKKRSRYQLKIIRAEIATRAQRLYPELSSQQAMKKLWENSRGKGSQEDVRAATAVTAAVVAALKPSDTPAPFRKFRGFADDSDDRADAAGTLVAIKHGLRRMPLCKFHARQDDEKQCAYDRSKASGPAVAGYRAASAAKASQAAAIWAERQAAARALDAATGLFALSQHPRTLGAFRVFDQAGQSAQPQDETEDQDGMEGVEFSGPRQ